MHPPGVEDALQTDYLRQAVDWCRRNPQGKWTAEVTRPVTTLLEEWKEQPEPELEKDLRQLCAEGRFSIGALAFHTTPLADRLELEMLVEEVPRLRRVTGAAIRCAFQHDINGLPWPVTEVLLDAGVELLITGINEGGQGRVVLGRDVFFHWQGPDGRCLPVYNADHYGAMNRDFHFMEGSVGAMVRGWESYRQKLVEQNHAWSFALMTATMTQPCDCNPPDEELVPLVEAWNREKAGPPIRFITGEELLPRLKAESSGPLPCHAGDWTDWWNFGCASTPFHMAMARRGRRRLRLAQRLSKEGGGASRLLGAGARVGRAIAAAREKLALWNEHTWNPYLSVMYPDVLHSRLHSDQKYGLAADGFAWADLAARHEMERVSGNPVESRGFSSVALFNPQDHAIHVTPRVPKEWLEWNASHNQAWLFHQSARLEYLGAGGENVAGSLHCGGGFLVQGSLGGGSGGRSTANGFGFFAQQAS
ncbi:MAG: hypothetical protein HC904_08680, partial [Blastochloris sp.]|nr:hypothetical protein [Blastochloris sp.]